MKLKAITLKNIRSYKDDTIEFPEGSTLLSGDIGSGKTSILLAIEFALFGIQPGQKGSSLLRNGEDTGGVKIDFSINNQEVTIERNMKRGRGITQDYCSIEVDGEKREISVTELKDAVLELLNYPKEFAKKQNLLYKFTVYTPQEEMKQIILQDSETRINTLRHVFGIDKYKKILENLGVLAAKLREEKRVKQAMTLTLEEDKLSIVSKENELENKYYNLDSIEKELFIKKENKKIAQDDLDEISKKIEEKRGIEKELEKSKILISSKKDFISQNTKSKEMLETQIKELSKLSFNESDLALKEKEIFSIKKDKALVAEKILGVSSNINSLNSKIYDSENLKKKMTNLEVCPTCLQDVNSSYKANVSNKADSDIFETKNKIQKLSNEKRDLEEKSQKMEYEISSKEKEIQELKILKIKLENLNEKKQRIHEIEKSLDSTQQDIRLLEEQMGRLKSSLFEFSKYDSIFEDKKKKLEFTQSEERLAEIKVAELKKEIEVFSHQIEELKKRILKLEEVKKEYDYLAEVESWLTKDFAPVVSLIEKNVMVKLKSEFSTLFSKWFSMLVSENFHAALRDDFTPVIEQQDYELDYAFLSGGERTAVALAYRLALNQVINSILSKIETRDLVILDEPTDGFSDSQLDKMREVLEELNVGQLIIVSHEQKIEGFVENVIKFRKENGVSQKAQDFGS